ncbi:MAG: hypothetical protein COA42_13360 [Alteromonadaceae bacterium]|nr:MAG: hypothetical protein COA42_13360 [Alteromonadaceae bacterium]
MKYAIVLFLIMITAPKAIACSCAFHDGSLEEAVTDSYKNASAVVLATAEHVENFEPLISDVWSEDEGHQKETYYNSQRTQFVALKSWKGEHGKRFFTEIVITCCMCGYRFEEGENYLLYLYGPDKKGNFGTSSCSRTKRETVKIEQELEILNKMGLTKSGAL